jgi:hypothetical protein
MNRSRSIAAARPRHPRGGSPHFTAFGGGKEAGKIWREHESRVGILH